MLKCFFIDGNKKETPMKKFALHWQILIALVLAIIFGILFKSSYQFSEKNLKKLAKDIPQQEMQLLQKLKGEEFYGKNKAVEAIRKLDKQEKIKPHYSLILEKTYHNKALWWIEWMGIAFLNALKMLIIPLILTSIISGMTKIGSGKSIGRLGFKTFGYYILSSLLAIGVGLFFVNLIQPGKNSTISFVEEVEGLGEISGSFGQILLDIIPENIFLAMVNGDVLPIIFFGILVGFFTTQLMQKQRESLTLLFDSLFELMMKITMFVIRFTPLGVFAIVAKVVAEHSDLLSLMQQMGWYMLTVILALSVHSMISLPLLLRFLGKANPRKHFMAMRTPLLTAFSTSSSGATLPLTMSAVEKKAGVSNKISSFTLPLGATINMDGTALYECVAALFIAQIYGQDITIAQQFLVVFTALIASIGAAAIPMAGLVMITVVLSVIGIPLEGVGLIIAVDRILDMFRTTVNVWSDSCGAVIIAKSEGEETNL